MANLAIDIDGTDHAGQVNLETLALVESADGGEVGSGGFDRDDKTLAAVPALKDVEITDARASPDRVFTGRTGVRTRARGGGMQAGTHREWDVTALDVNALLDDIVFEASGANRPAETDYARVTWLLTQLAAYGVSAGVVPNTNTVTLDAQDYRRTSSGPRQVLSDCGEAAQKNYFLYDHGAGLLLYYDRHTGTGLASTTQLSTVEGDADDATVFYAHDCRREDDPNNVFSHVVYEYEGGRVSRDASDSALTTETDYRYRATTVTDSRVKSSAKATAKADAYLLAASTETTRFTCSVTVPAEQVNDIRAGHRIEIKVPHLGYSVYTWFRIVRREVRCTPAERGGVVRTHYTLSLTFAENVKMTSFRDSRPPGDVDTGSTTDGAAQSMTRYQLFEREPGPAYYTAIGGGSWNDVPADFTFGTVPALTDSVVSRNGASYDITWPYGDCGIVAGVWAGRHHKEAWYRMAIDLADETVVGVRMDIDAPTAALDAVGATILCGAATVSAPTEAGQWTPVGAISDAGGSVFIPASLLQDDGAGYSWFVMAPGWDEPYGYMWCGAGSNPVAGSDNFDPAAVTATLVVVSGVGLSPWVSGVGAVDGTNADFSLPNWNGKGVPEVRVGTVVLGAGEYTYDSGALTVTLLQPPPADMAGQVAFRFKMG